MSTWIKVRKIFQGGQKEDYLFSLEDLSDEEMEDLAKDWGEFSSGGHNYGYTIYWERSEKPSNDVITKKIKDENSCILSRLYSVKESKLIVEHLKGELE